MGKSDLFMNAPQVTQEHTADGTPKIKVVFDVTNTGSDRLNDGEVIIAIAASSESASETGAELTFPLVALEAGASAQHGGPLQVDPGTWYVIVFLQDAATYEVLHSSDMQTVHIAGHATHATQFTDNAAYQVAPQITSIERLSGSTVRVHYNLTNTGSVAVPPGLEVVGYIDDEVKHVDSEQDYHLQRGVAVGPTDPHYLTLEGLTEPGSSWRATIWIDPGGPSSAASHASVTWGDDGRPSMTLL